MKQMVVVLVLVTLVSGIVLATVYTRLIPMIRENQRLATERSLSALFDGDRNPDFEEVPTDGTTVYRAQSDNGELLGYAVRVTTTGYGGEIQLLVGLTPDSETIRGIQVVEHIETPGLGGRITEDAFGEQFKGLDATRDITYVKNAERNEDDNEIEAISGATISSSAVVSGINNVLDGVFETLTSTGKDAP
ncbi:MAG: RnfABCDGE type electron transport complex subunit G [Alkalispirochaeta sp.]